MVPDDPEEILTKNVLEKLVIDIDTEIIEETSVYDFVSDIYNALYTGVHPDLLEHFFKVTFYGHRMGLCGGRPSLAKIPA